MKSSVPADVMKGYEASALMNAVVAYLRSKCTSDFDLVHGTYVEQHNSRNKAAKDAVAVVNLLEKLIDARVEQVVKARIEEALRSRGL